MKGKVFIIILLLLNVSIFQPCYAEGDKDSVETIHSINVDAETSVLNIETGSRTFSGFQEVSVNHLTKTLKFSEGKAIWPLGKTEGFFLFQSAHFWGLYYFNLEDNELINIPIWGIILGIILIIVCIQLIKKILYILLFLLVLYMFFHFKFDLGSTWSSLTEALNSLKSLIPLF